MKGANAAPLIRKQQSRYVILTNEQTPHFASQQAPTQSIYQTGGNERDGQQQFNTGHLLILAQCHQPPSTALAEYSGIFLSLSSKIHGSKEHEKEENFNASHLALSRHVGSVKFEMTE